MKTARDLTLTDWADVLQDTLATLGDPYLPPQEWAVFRISAGYQVALMQEHLTTQDYKHVLRTCQLSADMADGYKYLFWRNERKQLEDKK